MELTPLPRPRPDDADAAVQLDIVIPVYDEARQLAASVTALRSFLDASFPLATVVTIADNASTDDTLSIATGLAASLPGVRVLHLDRKGRGRALRAAWSTSPAPVVAYMDVDLATGLDALLPLVAPLLSGHSDVAIGTRLAPGAHVVRGARREVISRSYNFLVRTTLGNACTDAQCGFKAMRSDAAAVVLPLVEDDAWFFDTEVLVTAQRLGLRIHEVPVDWVDDTDSRVHVVNTALADLRGVARMLHPGSRQRIAARATDRTVGAPDAGPAPSAVGATTRLALVAPAPPDAASAPVSGPSPEDPGGRAGSAVFADELLRFAGVGAVSTVAYVALFAALEPGLGSYLANAVAIVLCSLGNTGVHRGMAGSARHGLDRPRRMAVAAGLMGVSLAATTVALAAVRAVGLDALLPELVAVGTANAVAAIARFAILRTWVFRPQFGTLGGHRPTDPAHVPTPVPTNRPG